MERGWKIETFVGFMAVIAVACLLLMLSDIMLSYNVTRPGMVVGHGYSEPYTSATFSFAGKAMIPNVINHPEDFSLRVMVDGEMMDTHVTRGEWSGTYDGQLVDANVNVGFIFGKKRLQGISIK